MSLTKADLDTLRSNISTDMKEHLKTELTPLVKQIASIDSAVQRLERSDRANNIIIHGITASTDQENSSRLLNCLEDLWNRLGITSPILIDNVYRLGRSVGQRPLLVKLVRNIDKQIILARRKEAAKIKFI
jgi:hypothetical protein